MASIVFNGRFLCRRPTGVDRFAYEVIAAIDGLVGAGDPAVSGWSFEVLAPDGAQAVPWRFVKVRTVPGQPSHFWEQFTLPRAVGDALLVSLCNTGPVVCRKQVAVIHDAATKAVPEAFGRAFRTLYAVLMPLLGRVCRRVVTVSEFSRAELVSRFGIPPSKIVVVGESGEHVLRTSPDSGAPERFGLGAKPYVLAVSSMAAHKNFRLVLEALALMPDPPFDVAIAGGSNRTVFGSAGEAVSGRVKWLGYVSDAELRALYEGAMLFVFPSVYEGFGIPPLEAMALGCPVVASQAASIPEVCGDAAQYVDPRSPHMLMEVLCSLASDPARLAVLSDAGRRRAAGMTWGAVARDLIQVFKGAAAGAAK